MKIDIGHGRIADTKNAKQTWQSKPGEALYLSQKDNFYSVKYYTNANIGSMMCRSDAAAWLVLNDHPLPEQLAEFKDICE